MAFVSISAFFSSVSTPICLYVPSVRGSGKKIQLHKIPPFRNIKRLQISSADQQRMAAAQLKQLEDKIARYERILSDCPRCKAALALEEVGDSTTLVVPPPSAGSSSQSAPNTSLAVSTSSHKPSTHATGQGRSTRSSKQAPSTSQPKPSSINANVVGPSSSTHGFSRRSGEIASDPTINTTRRPIHRRSKQNTAGAVSSVPGSSSNLLTFTSHSLDFRPTSLKPSAGGIGTLSTDSIERNTTGPSLSSSGSNDLRPQKNPRKQATWPVAADRMLGEVPLGWVWQARLLEMDKSMLAAVAIDTIIVTDERIDAVDDSQNKEHLLRLVQGFAHRHSDKRVNFQHFLLTCLCNILLTQNIPRESIVETLQICISDTGEGNILRYLRGARWANELLNRLFFTNWHYRAIDLLVLCTCGGQSLHFVR